MTEPQSALLLKKQLAELNKNPVEGFSAGLIDESDLYRWEVLIIGPPDTLYEGGVFKAHLTFPKDYPQRPPKMKFVTDIWHPNVDKNGDTQMVTPQQMWMQLNNGGINRMVNSKEKFLAVYEKAKRQHLSDISEILVQCLQGFNFPINMALYHSSIQSMNCFNLQEDIESLSK
uniref:UBC core domain-containing protein n=1 Tax=Knipowitschia caucasica TaxID=637954 RepID=A0AAV2J8F9_KNICA